MDKENKDKENDFSAAPVEPKEKPASSKGKADSDVVTIDRSQLEQLLGTIKRQSQDIDVLYKVADRNKLTKVREADGANLIKTCKVWVWTNGKHIIATKLVSNIAEVVNGRYVEDQQLEIMFDDGTTLKTSYLDFARNKKMVTAEITDRRPQKNAAGDDSAILVVVLSDGKQLTIAQEFIN